LETPREISAALSLLEHFHLAHCSGNVTRFVGATGCDIYVTADPTLSAKLLDLCKAGGAELGPVIFTGRRGVA
jgi:hypothetical protein